MQSARLLGAAATVALAASFAASPSALAATNVGDGPISSNLTKISLLNTNDFHGHFTKDFACTVTTAQNELGATFLSAGDNVGGTPFASASQNDVPAIDYLNALDLKASAVGNHEFDKGFADLTGRVQARANWTYLGANVYRAGTTTPALPAYKVLDVNGVKVGVVGAVTSDVPSLVAGDGISGLTFGDPVAAVNRTAAQLKDGDASNGEADVVVAEYHEGAAGGGEATLASQTARGGIFAKIVNGTAASVDAIFTGHTHQIYAWDAPAPGGGTRPVIQTDYYASHLGVLQLGYDPTTKKVTQYSVTNREVTAPTAACEADARYRSAATIVDNANARADVIGKQPVGKITADITTALKPDGSRDDRLRESTLSNLIAQSYVDSINKPGRPGGVEIGVMNPGGVRADLKYGTDGTVTYADVAAIMPFNNTVQTIEVTGAQFKQVLEQQWQPEGSSRAFLKLGLSKNVTYTYDPSAAAGSRITSVTVDGQPLDMGKTYTVASNSFLVGGGDNFTAFEAADATRKDSGLIDQSLFVEWFKDHNPASPSFAKNGVAVENQPKAVTQGEEVTFTVSGLDMTSAGAPTTTEVEVFLGTQSLGTFPVQKVLTTAPPFPTRNGTATITVKIPADAMTGAQQLFVKAAQTGTTVTMPVTVVAVDQPSPTSTPTASPTGTESPTASPTGTATSTPTSTPTGTPTGTVTGPPVVTDGNQSGGSSSSNGGLFAGAGALFAMLLAGAWVLGRRLS